jgi:hypothetical protein
VVELALEEEGDEFFVDPHYLFPERLVLLLNPGNGEELARGCLGVLKEGVSPCV